MSTDRAWHKQMRADMPTVYDAIADRAFWHGVGITVAVLGGLWLLAGVR